MHSSPDSSVDSAADAGLGYRMQAVACALVVNLLDGFDVLAISFAAPSIVSEWALSPERLGLLFSVGLTGMVLASIFVAGIADYIGRRRTILASLLLICIAMAGSGLANTLETLAFWRFLVGLGVGTILPSLNTIVAEFAPRKRREVCVAAMQAGYPAGGILGGVVAVLVIASFGWRGIFLVGAALSFVALLASLRYLPESMDFLVARRPTNALSRINTIRRRLSLAELSEVPTPPTSLPQGHGYRALLNLQLALRTLCLSMAFFFVMASFYFVASWTPKLLVDAGLELTAGLSGGIVVSVGGIIGGVLLGWQAPKFGARKLTSIFMLLTAPAMLVFSQTTSLEAMFAAAFVMGFFLVGSMMGLYVLTPGVFDVSIRATATGVGVGLGRMGAILGPLLTGFLVANEWDMASLYLIFGIPVLLSACIVWLLDRQVQGSRPPTL